MHQAGDGVFVNELKDGVMVSLLDAVSVEDAAKTLRDLKPPKRCVECCDS